MRALDTNVLVRFVTADNPTQLERVSALFHEASEKQETLYVSLPVVLELMWVLTSTYEVSRDALVAALDQLISLPFLSLRAGALYQGLPERNPVQPTRSRGSSGGNQRQTRRLHHDPDVRPQRRPQPPLHGALNHPTTGLGWRSVPATGSESGIRRASRRQVHGADDLGRFVLSVRLPGHWHPSGHNRSGATP